VRAPGGLAAKTTPARSGNWFANASNSDCMEPLSLRTQPCKRANKSDRFSMASGAESSSSCFKRCHTVSITFKYEDHEDDNDDEDEDEDDEAADEGRFFLGAMLSFICPWG